MNFNVALCDSLEIHEEMPRKQLRNMIIGTDLTTENPLIDSDKESESAEPQSPEPMAIEGPKTVDQDLLQVMPTGSFAPACTSTC